MISALQVNNTGSKRQERSNLPHVLLIVDELNRTLGGGERIALTLAGLLPDYGFSASILTFFAHPESPALKYMESPIYLLPLARTYDLRALRAAFELKQFLSRQRVHIVHTFFESADIWGGFVTKALSSAKLVWSRRDMGILRSRKHILAYRLMSRLPDAVFAVSEQVRKYCIEVDGVDPVRVQTIHNGLNLSGWTSPSRHFRESDGLHVTSVGNIRRVKGHDLFVRAAAIIAARLPNVSFSIAGEVLEQRYFEELQALVQELHLSGRFTFRGGVTDLHQHLASADIFVLPSRSEGFSNAIIEAMAASLPVVATDVGGNSEAVIHGETGFIVAPEDPHALSAAILRLISDPEQAKAMGAAGRKLAEQRFSLEAMMIRICREYRDLLAAT